MKMLNIACGGRYHRDWINIDFHADSNEVKKVNLLGGLPFENNTIDIAYSSHFLEHLSLDDGKSIVSETYRVLKKDGIIRIVVPDLENVCREYIAVLDSIRKNSTNSKKHQWITIELLDQLTRDIGGGYMQKIFDKVSDKKDKYLADYILYRTGDDILQEKTYKKRKITFDKIKNKLLYIYLDFIQLLIPKNIRQQVFVNTSIGEKHRWMYDRHSLSKLLKEVGFNNIIIQDYNSSQIKDFNNYNLDCKSDGTSYKGVHSLYIEATK